MSHLAASSPFHFHVPPAATGLPPAQPLPPLRVGLLGLGTVGAGTLAVAVGEEGETVESVVEPYLVRIGFLGRTPRGRVAMPEAYAHLGVKHPDGMLTLDDL